MSKKKVSAVGSLQNQIDVAENTLDNDIHQKKHVHQRPKIDYKLTIKERDDFTEKQKTILAKCLHKDTKCLFCDGYYGTAKSYTVILAALKLLDSKRIDEIIYLRNPVESTTTGKIGFLKGSTEDKMAPYNAILFDKLAEFLSPSDIKKLQEDKVPRLTCMPIGFIRGQNWSCKAIVVDEASSMSYDDIMLILSRCSEFTRVFLVGDSANQNDIGGKSGFRKMFDLFNDEESRNNGVFAYELRDRADIVRSGFLRFVMEKVGILPREHEIPRKEPMFE